MTNPKHKFRKLLTLCVYKVCYVMLYSDPIYEVDL